MNVHVKNFLIRGLMFSGLGPIIVCIIWFSLWMSGVITALTPSEAILSVVSIYILAFLVAGASIIYNIEKWSMLKSTLIHGIILYVCYILCYLINSWINPDIKGILIFTGSFIIGYICVWLSVFFSIKGVSKRLNDKLASRGDL